VLKIQHIKIYKILIQPYKTSTAFRKSWQKSNRENTPLLWIHAKHGTTAEQRAKAAKRQKLNKAGKQQKTKFNGLPPIMSR
jgi:hypothetical protein